MHVLTLLGEQPIPSLMVLRHLKPDSFTVVATEFTAARAEGVMALVDGVDKNLLYVPPYQFKQAVEIIRQHVDRLLHDGKEVVFDLTGATKVMALAAYEVARAVNAAVFYLRTQRECSLFRYGFNKIGVFASEDVIPLNEEAGQLITLEDYLRVYLGDFHMTGPCQTGPGRSFEIAVRDALSSALDEVILGIKAGGALDIDLAVRHGTRVGIAELKTGKKAKSKRPLEQLNAACSREFLGTYTIKFLIMDCEWHEEYPNLEDLARAWGVMVIGLSSFRQDGALSKMDRDKLIESVKAVLEG